MRPHPEAAIGAQTACLSVPQHHRVVRRKFFLTPFSTYCPEYTTMANRHTSPYRTPLYPGLSPLSPLGIRATTGIQLLLDGFEGTDSAQPFGSNTMIFTTPLAFSGRLRYRRSGHTWTCHACSTPAAGLRDVILLTAAHIHLNRMKASPVMVYLPLSTAETACIFRPEQWPALRHACSA